jgi:polyisoprenoid-binding protein YceI
MSTTQETQERTLNEIALPPAGRYELDPAHTSVEFVARHLISKVRGRFTEFAGQITLDEDLERSEVHVEIHTASVHTGSEQRDQHLRSGDFFLIDEHPVMSFTSTGLRVGEGSAFELDGTLTINGIANPVTLEGSFNGWGPHPYGGDLITFSARTTIDREDWDITWNSVVETGGVLVGRTVDIELEIEAIRQEG